MGDFGLSAKSHVSLIHALQQEQAEYLTRQISGKNSGESLILEELVADVYSWFHP